MDTDKDEPFSRRPDNSAFKQQRLPAWTPMLTARSVLPFLYFTSLICLLLGVWLTLTVHTIQEIKLDYTHAGTCDLCYEKRKNVSRAAEPCSCVVTFNVQKRIKVKPFLFFCSDQRSNERLILYKTQTSLVTDAVLQGDVFFYYGLKNFHQNLRRYMDSRDDTQMAGRKKNLKLYSESIRSTHAGTTEKPRTPQFGSEMMQNVVLTQNPSSYCQPFISDPNGLPIAPCGAVANSIFNDSFSLTYHGSRPSAPVPLLRSGITWYTDKNIKFRNPRTDNMTLAQVFEGTAKPPYWQRPVYELDTNPTNNGFLNEDLIVWMREAAFPNFKKLYGVLNRSQKPFTKGLPVGNYSIDINYTLTSTSPDFPVQPFQGRKEVVLTTLTWFGGQNLFLPIAYIVTGSVVLLLAVALTVIWWKFGRNGKN
ncbi:unnamed protein product, partial [Tetraodon nigroviridis]